MQNPSRVAGAMAAAASVALLAIGQASARTAFVPCGLVVTATTTLRHDLDFSGGPGVCIQGDDITLNLNGHTIQGGGGWNGETGVLIMGGTNDRVRNGTVANFYYDVRVDSATDAAVQNLQLVTDDYQSNYGVYVWTGTGTIVRNVTCANAYSCVGLDGPGNEATGVANALVTESSDKNSLYAFWDDYGVNNTFTRNRAKGSAFGIPTYLTTGDTISQNVATGTDTGFYDTSSVGLTYADDRAANGHYGFFLVGNNDVIDGFSQAGYTLLHNTSSGNTSYGFYSEYGFTWDCACATDQGSSFVENTAKDNGADGFFDYWSINSTWSGNTATGNAGTGFLFEQPQNDVITGNTAKNNAQTGMWLDHSDAADGYATQSFSNNRAQRNQAWGLFADAPQSGSGNIAKNNTPYDCWNVSCQPGATPPTAPALLSRPSAAPASPRHAAHPHG